MGQGNYYSEKISTYNSAKKFADEILHELMKSQCNSKIISRLGALSVLEANRLSPDQRTVVKYNATKERIIFQQTLINEIEATVVINAVQIEIDLLNKLKTNLDDLEQNFEDRKDEIMEVVVIQGVKRPTLTTMFSDINKYLDTIYVQIQRIMTKNKLLFTSSNDDYLEDQELKEKIKADNLKN